MKSLHNLINENDNLVKHKSTAIEGSTGVDMLETRETLLHPCYCMCLFIMECGGWGSLCSYIVWWLVNGLLSVWVRSLKRSYFPSIVLCVQVTSRLECASACQELGPAQCTASMMYGTECRLYKQYQCHVQQVNKIIIMIMFIYKAHSILMITKCSMR